MNLSQYLEQLGPTSEAVAESLRQQGVKGLRKSNCHCPIICAIYQAIPDYWQGLRILGGGTSQDGFPYPYFATLRDLQIVDPVLPEPVKAFIRDFDEGLYPDLVAQKVTKGPVLTWE